MDEKQLDNAVWNALTSVHAPLALRRGGEVPRRRFPVGGHAAFDSDAFNDLAALTPYGEQVAFFTPELIAVPSAWARIRERWIDQMVCEEPPTATGQPFPELSPVDRNQR